MSDIFHTLKEMQELRKRAQRSDEIEDMKTSLQIVTGKSISGIKIRSSRYTHVRSFVLDIEHTFSNNPESFIEIGYHATKNLKFQN